MIAVTKTSFHFNSLIHLLNNSKVQINKIIVSSSLFPLIIVFRVTRLYLPSNLI